MDREKIQFFINSGIILNVLGIVSIVYSTIIPVIQYPYNAFARWFFVICGIVFVSVGILLIITMRQRYPSREKTRGDSKNGQ